MLEFGHGTHVGLRRVRNEDTYYADATLGLFLVADGMGGHRRGEVAAALVRDTMVDLATQGRSLGEAVQAAAERLLGYPRRVDDDLPMGSTIAALQLSAGSYHAAWVGDSRIYGWQGSLRQISHDDSAPQALPVIGRASGPTSVAKYARRGVLTQALGITPGDRLRIGVAQGELVRGMGFLLCTDGLTDGVLDAAIARVISCAALAPQECVDQLLLGALDAGGQDNVTAVLVRVS
jgi:protein phosphatase